MISIGEIKRELINRYRYLIYMLCTVGICWIGVWRDIGTGAQWAFASNCIGICVFPMILCRYKIREFFRLPYALWVVFFAVFIIPICRKMLPGTDYDLQIVSAALNVFLYGLIAIRLFIYIFADRKCCLKNYSLAFWLWLGMMLACCISRNEATWPFWYIVMFGAYYLVQVPKKDLNEMVKGIIDGIIIAFFWVQIRAFLYRPYDTGGAYYGHFTNNIVNGMFYTLSLAGVLSRLWIVSRRNSDKTEKNKIYSFLLYILAISILVFSFYTGSRAAVLATLGMLTIYLFLDSYLSSEKRICSFVTKSVVSLLTFALLLYPIYACARYIPAIRHHPVWYNDYSENKVHSWDPIDSEKYTSFKEALKKNGLSRVLEMFTANEDDLIIQYVAATELTHTLTCGIGMLDVGLPIMTPVKTVDFPGATWVYEYDDGIPPGSDPQHRVLVNVEIEKIKEIRFFIWKYFIDNLNVLGHKELYFYVYIGEPFGHAHNAFLQIAYSFGLPAGLLFFLSMIFAVVISALRLCSKVADNSGYYIFSLMLLAGYVLFGTFDCLSLTGQSMFTMFFLAIDLTARKMQ